MRKALLAIALTCLSFTAYAQVGANNGLRIQYQNQGTAIGTFTNWLPINCSTGMSCSFSGGIVTMTATGGGALTPPITISDTAANTDLSLINTTAATSGAARSSPIFDLQGKYWTGAASAADDWTIKSALSNGTNGTSTLTFTHTGSTSQAVAMGASVSGTSFTAVAAGTFNWTGRSALFSPADGKIELLNNAGTAFTSLQFGGITSSFPEIKVNGTALNFRLADDSADAAITASNITTTGTASPDVMTEQAAPVTPSATLVDYWADSTDHRLHDKDSSGNVGTTVVASAATTGQAVSAVSAAGVISKASFATPLYDETSASGTTTTTVSGVDTAMFTGYSMPGNTLTAGHRLHIHACWKHSTGTTSTTYKISIAAVVTTALPAGTGVPFVCVDYDYAAVDSTHQQLTEFATAGLAGTLSGAQQAAYTTTLSGTVAINFVANAASNTDVNTAYLLTVDLY